MTLITALYKVADPYPHTFDSWKVVIAEVQSLESRLRELEGALASIHVLIQSVPFGVNANEIDSICEKVLTK